MSQVPTVGWSEAGAEHQARWLSGNEAPPPRRIVIAEDSMRADAACALATQGTALLWRGDYHNARQLLAAMSRRIDRPAGRRTRPARRTPQEQFHQLRQAQAQRARTLGALLVPVAADHGIALRRAPDVRQALQEALGAPEGPALISLRMLLGIIGAHQWRLRGIEVPAAGGRIHPHYGVFAPVRSEYVDLVAAEALPEAARSDGSLAFDIGTGTGVLAAVLARRGLHRVIATDLDARALACARENLTRLSLSDRVEVVAADLFPPGRATLVVCNPPWVPARPSAPIERGIYDEGGAMLRGFLGGLRAHLVPGGEAWLVLSDLAEHLGLRSREELLALIAAAGLVVAGRSEAKPTHRKASDASDPLHAARAAEVTSLWRLRAAGEA